jgi:hypothetical protein
MPRDIATVIVQASIEHSLFSGTDGDRQSAAMMTAIARYESGFRQVFGDCKDKPAGWPGCGKDPGARVGEPNGPTSFCFMQIHLGDTPAAAATAKTAEGWTYDDLMKDPLKCARAAREIIRKSILASPPGQPLLQYAGHANMAKTRWELAQKLFKSVPEIPIKCDE